MEIFRSTTLSARRWEDLDRWKWVIIDVGVILDTSAGHFENFFSTFSAAGWGPLSHTVGCHQNFDIVFLFVLFSAPFTARKEFLI